MPAIKGTLSTAATLLTSRQRTISLAAGDFTAALAEDELNNIGDWVTAEVVSGNLTNFKVVEDTAQEQADVNQVSIGLRWLYASAKPTVHMHVDLEGLTVLANLLAGDSNATANARAAVLATAWASHIAGVGTVAANGEHKAADTTNTLPTNPTSLPSLITWINGAKVAIIGHGNQSGVHFTADTGTGGTGFTMTVDPPVTQADCNNDLNDILAAMKTHFNLGTAVLPFPDVE